MGLGVVRAVLPFVKLFLSDMLQLLLLVPSFSEAREQAPLGGVLESSWGLCGVHVSLPGSCPGPWAKRWKIRPWMHMSPAEADRGHVVPSRFSSPAGNQRPSHGLFSAMFFTFLCCVLVISLLRTAPKPSAEVPCRVPEWKKAEMCLREQTHVLDKPVQAWVMVLLAVFHINEPEIYIKEGIFIQKHT